MEGNVNGGAKNECGICLGEWTSSVRLPCGHSFCAKCLSGWKSKYASSPDELKKQQSRCCPLCRGAIPPLKEEVANYKGAKLLVKNRDKS
mmetsp:Transcript_13334/g.31510  ORF Transcript_13334/g.31510 Transcript_13334/m.31510 type:complete len:90 (+) Transcript_13334:254-523(+)